MRKGRKIGIVVMTLLLAVTAMTAAAIAQMVRGPAQVFELEYTTTYKNNNAKTANVEVSMPIPGDWPPHQRVTKIEYSPVPVRKEKDSRGDVLVFRFEKVPPGGAVRCKIICATENHRVIHLVSRKKVTGRVPERVKPFLAKTRRYPYDAPAVRKLLARLVKAEDDRYVKLLKIYDYVRRLNYRLSARSRSVEEVISTGICQCADASDLMITLCRGAGVPARFAGGFYLKEADRFTPDTHAWVEVYLAPYGWLPADPTMARFNFFTRLSRFLEVDSPYLLMWRDYRTPFRVYSSLGHKEGGEEAFSLEVKYRAGKPRQGVPVKSIYRAFNLDTEPRTPSPPLPENSAARKLYVQGSDFADQGKWNEAMDRFTKVTRLEPAYLQAYLQLYGIYAQAKKLKVLEGQMTTLLKEPRSGGPAMVVLGLIQQDRGNIAQSVKYYDRARKMGVNSYLLDGYRGDVLLQLKQLSPAAAALDRSILSDPSYLPAYSVTFDLLNYLEDYPSVIKLCRLGLSVRPLADFNYQMARAHFHLQQYKKAEKQARTALSAAPRQGAFMGIMGRIYLKTGREKQGRELIKKAMTSSITADEKDELQEVLDRHRD